MNLKTFFRHLRRESRGSRGKLVFFVACLALGVAAVVVAVAGFSLALDRGIRREARQMLAADLSVRGLQPITPEIEEAVDAIAGARRTGVLETLTLVAAGEAEPGWTRSRCSIPPDAPTAFLIDIQPDQWSGVEALLADQNAVNTDSVPMVTARLSALDGCTAEELLEDIPQERGDARWALRREQRLTYLEELPEGNEVVAGELWSDPAAPEVSVEEEFAELIGIEVG